MDSLVGTDDDPSCNEIGLSGAHAIDMGGASLFVLDELDETLLDVEHEEAVFEILLELSAHEVLGTRLGGRIDRLRSRVDLGIHARSAFRMILTGL